jgi:hypothetical protein
VSNTIDPSGWYSARETASLLKDQVTEATVKEYCKSGKLTAKKSGPRKRWVVSGVSIKKLRKEWDID